MIHNRTLIVSLLDSISSKKFQLGNGLQQGTINSPILFNIFTADLLKFFSGETTDCILIAYADDLIIYNIDRKPDNIKDKLQKATEKIFDYYNTWKLKVNVDKCETILFRPSIRNAKHPIPTQYKKFVIRDPNDPKLCIKHNNTVKYLGINLDSRFRLNGHVETQLKKLEIRLLV